MTQNFLILQNSVLCRSLISQKCQFWVKVSMQLKMSGFYQALSKISFWAKFPILPNHDSKFLDFAKFHRWYVPSGQNSQFWAWFLLRLKFLNFTNFHLSHVLNGQKCQFWAKFLTRIKISSLAGQGWSNSWFQVKFTTRLKISGLCQNPSFAGLEWSKISFLSQIFNATENFLILPNFYLCMSRVVKTINSGLNFYCDWKFLNFTKFHHSHVLSGQKCMF